MGNPIDGDISCDIYPPETKRQLWNDPPFLMGKQTLFRLDHGFSSELFHSHETRGKLIHEIPKSTTIFLWFSYGCPMKNGEFAHEIQPCETGNLQSMATPSGSSAPVGRLVLVTGAARGLGVGICKQVQRLWGAE